MPLPPLKLHQRQVLAARRVGRGLSQRALAEAIGVSQPFVVNVEQGRKAPSEELLQRWCAALGLQCEVIHQVRIVEPSGPSPSSWPPAEPRCSTCGGTMPTAAEGPVCAECRR